MSLSARRAWIEMVVPSGCWLPDHVALRKESVDRNRLGVCHYRDDVSSLSARRAWIEITVVGVLATLVTAVALRKESVDRNRLGVCHYRDDVCRSPQGERG